MNKLDKIFKHKLEHYNAEFPSDAWDKIEARLPKPQKTNRLLWPILSLVLVLVIAGVSGFYFNQSFTSNLHIKPDLCENNLIASNGINNAQNINLEIEPNHQLLVSSENKVIEKTSENQRQATENSWSVSKPISQLENEGISKGQNNESESVSLAVDQRNSIHIDAIQNLVSSHLSSKNSKVLKFVTFAIKETESKACPFVFEGRDKSLDIYYSSDFIQKSLHGPATMDSHKKLRQETELPMYSFSAGFRFGYNLSYRWNLYTGANYSQINEKFKYIDPESNSTRVITIKDYIYENGRIVDSIVKEETVVIPGTTIHTIYNKFRTIDIPLLARYTILANRHLSVSAVSGVFVNIATFQKGMILNPIDQKPMDVLAENADGYSMYKTNVGVSLYGGLSLAYHLGANTDLLLEPNFRWQTESMTHQSYPLDQKINTFSLSTGIRFKF